MSISSIIERRDKEKQFKRTFKERFMDIINCVWVFLNIYEIEKKHFLDLNPFTAGIYYYALFWGLEPLIMCHKLHNLGRRLHGHLSMQMVSLYILVSKG